MSRREKDPTASSDEHNTRGIELADRGWLDEAIREFRKAIELDPHAAHAHDNLASVYSEKKLYREALHEHLEAIRLEPESSNAHYNLASFLASHAPDMAVEEYRESIALDPHHPDAHVNLGMTYADQGKIEDALREIKRAIELAPDDPFPRHELAALCMDEGDHRGALAQLREVVRLAPENFEAQIDLAICYTEKGFYEEAERALLRAGELEGDRLLWHYHAAALYAVWGKAALAIQHLAGAVELDGKKARAWVADDPMFEELRRNPEYETLVGRGPPAPPPLRPQG